MCSYIYNSYTMFSVSPTTTQQWQTFDDFGATATLKLGYAMTGGSEMLGGGIGIVLGQTAMYVLKTIIFTNI